MSTRNRKQQSNPRKLMWWATATLMIGLLPIISSLFVELISPPLNCLVIEHGAYTKGASFAEDPGDLILGCVVGGMDIGPALHEMHLFIYAIALTWPILILSLMLWLKLIFHIKRRM